MPFNINRETARDAVRLALQSALAAVASFLLLTWIGSDETFVGVISAVLIVQPSVGSTVSEGWDRLIATLVGSIIGIVCLLLMPPGYGAAISLAVIILVINFVAGFRPSWKYGVVAAIALALADNGGDLDVAQARGIAITIGILTGVLATLVVWPDSASARALRHQRRAIRALVERFQQTMSRDPDKAATNDARRRFHEALTDSRSAAVKSTSKQHERAKSINDQIERLYTSVLVIDRANDPFSAQENGPDMVNRLSESGCAAISTLIDDDADSSEALQKFESDIDALESSMTSEQIETDDGQRAASAVFALKEILDVLRSIHDENEEAIEGNQNKTTLVNELKPAALD